MKYLLEEWSLEQLKDEREQFNPRPQYQRIIVWTKNKKQLLIDSILTGLDLPKFYLRTYTTSGNYKFDVADGQQRINAILEFFDDKLPLNKGTIVNGENLSKKYYSDLSDGLQKKFDNYSIAVCSIIEAKDVELNTLFIRLQGGVHLIPVELRHAIPSNIGRDIRKSLVPHKFFKESQIPNRRFKHQDYADHAVALAYYNLPKDVKAHTLMELYVELADSDKSKYSHIIEKIKEVLESMRKINEYHKGIFKNKWGFLDNFWILFSNWDKIISINYLNYANSFSQFEVKRKHFSSSSEELIKDSKSEKYNPKLFKYISAFNTSGALKDNIEIRSEVLKSELFTKNNVKLKD